MKKSFRYALCIAVVLLSTMSAFAASMSYSVAPGSNYSVPSSQANAVFVNADSGNVAVPVTLSLTNVNHVTFPVSLTMSANTGAGDPAVTISPSGCTFAGPSSTCTVTVSFTSQPSEYNFTIGPDAARDAANHPAGLQQSLTFHHRAAAPAPECVVHATALTVSSGCAIYHQPSAGISFTLRDAVDNTPVTNATISYSVQGGGNGTAVTDGSGSASVSIDASSLSVGNHTISASYAGAECHYAGSVGIGNLGLHYNVSPFLQPIPSPVNRFKGRTIPAKIRVTDYYGVSVPDAAAYFWYQATSACGAESTEPVVDGDPLANTNGNGGNLFRYDPTGQIYIFNWDLANVPAGWYTVSVNLGEGSCGGTHSACVQVVK